MNVQDQHDQAVAQIKAAIIAVHQSEAHLDLAGEIGFEYELDRSRDHLRAVLYALTGRDDDGKALPTETAP